MLDIARCGRQFELALQAPMTKDLLSAELPTTGRRPRIFTVSARDDGSEQGLAKARLCGRCNGEAQNAIYSAGTSFNEGVASPGFRRDGDARNPWNPCNSAQANDISEWVRRLAQAQRGWTRASSRGQSMPRCSWRFPAAHNHIRTHRHEIATGPHARNCSQVYL